MRTENEITKRIAELEMQKQQLADISRHQNSNIDQIIQIAVTTDKIIETLKWVLNKKQ